MGSEGYQRVWPRERPRKAAAIPGKSYLLRHAQAFGVLSILQLGT